MKTTCCRPLVRVAFVAGLALNFSFLAAAADPAGETLRAGTNYLATPVYSAEAVARYAQKILAGDKAGRRGLYEKLGRPADDSVK